VKIREGKKPGIYLLIFLAGYNLKQYEAADFAALRAVLWQNGFILGLINRNGNIHH
jgi:hypothetical protein